MSTQKTKKDKKTKPSGSSPVYQTIWEMNKPIDVDNYKPIAQQKNLPVITKVESISSKKKTNDFKDAKNAMLHVCNLLGLNGLKTVKSNRDELRRKSGAVNCDLDLESDLVKTCKSIFISQLPQWFEHFHVEALIQLKSEFDVTRDAHYIDMFKNFQNEYTGECLLWFAENKDCLQVFKDLQGTCLLVWPLIINLYLGHEIANMRDSHNNENFEDKLRRAKEKFSQESKKKGLLPTPHRSHNNTKIGEKFQKFKEKCLQENKKGELSGTPDRRPSIRVKSKQEINQDNVQIRDSSLATDIATKTEQLQQPMETEISIENNVKRETNKQKEANTGVTDGQNSEDDDDDDDTVHDHHFFNSKIVHISNLDTMSGESYYDLLRSWIINKLGKSPTFTYRKVVDELSTRRPTGDVLLEFRTHREARKVAKALNGYFDQGRIHRAIVGPGYELSPVVTASVLEMFQRNVAEKRKLENDEKAGKEENQQPAKKARTEKPRTSTPSNESSQSDRSNLMTPDERCFEAYGLSREFIVKHKLRVPFSRTVIVTRIQKNVTKSELVEIFSLAGDVKKAIISEDEDNRKYNKAVIDFDHQLEAVQAIAMLHGQKLFDVDMDIKMEEVTWRAPKPLPVGLSAVGPGLANNGGPMRGLRNYADLRLLNEMFVELGLMERISNTNKPFKFCYKKLRPKDRPINSIAHNLNAKDSSKTNGTTSTSKESDEDPGSPNHAQFAIQALGTVLVAQGLIPPTTNCKSLQDVLSALQNNAAQKNNECIRQDQQPAQNYVTASSGSSGNRNPSKNDALNDTISQIMQCMPTNATQNVAQSFQNPNPSLPIQNTSHIPRNPGNVMPNPSGYGLPPNPTPLVPNPTMIPVVPRQPIPIPRPTQTFPPTIPIIGPRTPQNVPPRPFLNQMPQNICQPLPTPPSYNQMQVRGNLIPVPIPSPQVVHNTTQPPGIVSSNVPAAQPNSKAKSPVPSTSTSDTNDQSSNKSEMLVFSKLPPCVTTDILASKMREIGELKFCETTSNGKAFVRFCKLADAERCIRLFHHSKVDGQVIVVGFL